METPGHSKPDTVEAKANQFADTTVKDATLKTRSAQPRECPLLSINPAKEIRFLPTGSGIHHERKETDTV